MPFLKLLNIWKSNKALEGIYSETGEMNKECKRIFLLATESLINGEVIPLAEMADEDRKINKYEVDIREKLLRYLAFTSAPNLSSTMILLNTVVSYERIGDYSKAVAGLGVNFPIDFKEESEYFRIITFIKDTIVKQFDLTYKGFMNSDPEKAKQVIESYQGIKSLHEALVARLGRDDKIDNNSAIVYASLGIYMRRTGAHLKNICTSVLYPSAEFGFAHKEDIK